MGGNCSFYEESAWRERLEASADLWSMHAFLRVQQQRRVPGAPGLTETWRANNGIPETCPREAIEDGLCLFHLPPHRKDDAQVRDRLVEAVRSGERADRQLDGARFGDLDLSGLDLGADRVSPVDLRFAQVEGELNLEKTVIPRGMFSMRFAQVEGPANCRSAQFGSTATFYHVTFAESVSFYRARFESKAPFCGVSVGGSVNFGKGRSSRRPTFGTRNSPETRTSARRLSGGRRSSGRRPSRAPSASRT